VPGPTVYIFGATKNLRKAAVDILPARKGRVLVHRGAHKRMPELQPAVLNRDETGSFCLLQRGRAAALGSGGPQDDREISGFLRGPHQQQMLGGRRQLRDALREDALDAAAEWQRLGKRGDPRALCGGQHGGELQ
jgi:hypothetical protein